MKTRIFSFGLFTEIILQTVMYCLVFAFSPMLQENVQFLTHQQYL